MTGWEYRAVECLKHTDLVKHANELGGEGWEMIDIVEPHGFYVGVFKRPATGEAFPAVDDRTGEGVLLTAGGF